MRIVLTQVRPRVDALARRLTAAGHECLILSFSALTTASEAPSAALIQTRVAAAAWVVAVSPGALSFLVEGLAACPGWRWPSGCRLALIGPGSAEALDALRVDVAPIASGILPHTSDVLMAPGPPFDGEQLGRLPGFREDPGSVLVIQGGGASRPWVAALQAEGRSVEVLRLYERRSCAPTDADWRQLRDWLNAGDPAALCWSFSQADAVAACFTGLDQRRELERARLGRAFANHPRVWSSLVDAGWSRAFLIDPGESALRRTLESPP